MKVTNIGKEEDLKIRKSVDSILEDNCTIAHLQAVEILSKEQSSKYEKWKLGKSKDVLNQLNDKLIQAHQQFELNLTPVIQFESSQIGQLLKNVGIKEDAFIKKFEKNFALEDALSKFGMHSCYVSEIV